MNMLTFDVVIPIKDRATLQQCVESLNQATVNLPLHQILTCDGGSQQLECLQQMQNIQQYEWVQRLDRPHEGFNKGWLINQGILASTADIILISDVDIIWNEVAVSALVNAVSEHQKQIACVRSVVESVAQNVALTRSRYAYRINPSAFQLEIYHDFSQPLERPGCGLLCARRSQLLELGGYREDFQGWGWEDQDLLIRAQLLGDSIQTCGEVIHLSHDDRQRNAYSPNESPQQSRDRNIQKCLARLAIGHFWGDLIGEVMPRLNPIEIVYPPELGNEQ
jgi:glycosyltransferase involved in cell wall biosynthesis